MRDDLEKTSSENTLLTNNNLNKKYNMKHNNKFTNPANKFTD